jgi:hypothetical protein
MATHVSTAHKKGFGNYWVSILAALALVMVVGVAFAAGRTSAPVQVAVGVPAQGNIGSQFSGMMPWMQTHAGDIAWMQAHMGDVAWMQNHWDQWRWMQAHPASVGLMQAHLTQWRWMQAHPAQWQWMRTRVGDIGWVHDHWTQWNGWRSSMGNGAGSWSNGSNAGAWNWGGQ